MNKMGPLFKNFNLNGMEMANHKWVTKKTGMPVYFAHPYAAWERGTNKNTNGLIRRYLPKETDFNLVSETELKNIEDKFVHLTNYSICCINPLNPPVPTTNCRPKF